MRCTAIKRCYQELQYMWLHCTMVCGCRLQVRKWGLTCSRTKSDRDFPRLHLEFYFSSHASRWILVRHRFDPKDLTLPKQLWSGLKLSRIHNPCHSQRKAWWMIISASRRFFFNHFYQASLTSTHHTWLQKTEEEPINRKAYLSPSFSVHAGSMKRDCCL